MKKGRILSLLIVVLLLILAVSIYVIETSQQKRPGQAGNDEPNHSESFTIDETEETVDQTENETVYQTQPNNLTRLENIPVYNEEDVLFHRNKGFSFFEDSCVYDDYSWRQNATSGLLEAFPTSAIRSRDEEMAYFVYSLDSGYRLYLFSSYENDLTTLVGFPVVVENLLSYKDFAGIQLDDRIEAVEAIDPVTSLYKREMLQVWGLDPTWARNRAARGCPCTSIHYLRDGILKIEYKMLDDRSLVISNMVFNKDYELESVNGKVINYRIEEVDLPTS